MTPKIVGVIFSRADLRRALRMRKPPDLFELRLDSFANRLAEVRAAIPKLAAPLIITARRPDEGGAHNLSAAQRSALLLEFLPSARYVDVELRSVPELRSVLKRAAADEVATIISFHDFQTTPRPAQLDRIAARARSSGAALVKVATRTDTQGQLDTLLDFFSRQQRASVIAMGIGQLGRASRLELARRGSILNYVHLGSRAATGQLSIEQWRRFAGRADAVS
jgi:3-dehydroquinate dehydratase-1